MLSAKTRPGLIDSPAYEGWIQNDDGSKTLVFGYINRNWSEELDIPVGENNFPSPGPKDRGQPTHFRPRRNRFVFMLTVPADFDEELVWTLTTQGQSERAYGTPGIDQALDEIVIASETGALGIGVRNLEIRANQTPVITVEGGNEHSVRVGQHVELAVRMEDDGLAAAYENWAHRDSTDRSFGLRHGSLCRRRSGTMSPGSFTEATRTARRRLTRLKSRRGRTRAREPILHGRRSGPAR